jgi:hypothetical protein
MGSTSRLASSEQQKRLFEIGGMLHVELLSVDGHQCFGPQGLDKVG